MTVENFVRAESDLYLSAVALKEGGFGKFEHHRELSPVDSQTIIRQNRDTLYSAAVFDLDAGPVTITLPDAGKRFMSLQAVSEDMYSPPAAYKPGPHTLTREDIGTRYVLVGVRTLVDPALPKDLDAAHALQDALKVKQKSVGVFEMPKWDQESQSRIRKSLIELGTTMIDTSHAFGTREQVDPIQHLVSAATTWGGNPRKDAIYLNFTPSKNDGKTIYKLHLGDVPVDGFWSVSLYNAQGYFQKNDLDAYSLNNITARKGADGSTDIQFGGCDGKVVNCLPIMPGWNYTARLYRPRNEILKGKWTFPDPVVAD
ncbi:carboxylesterase [Rhizobium sp. Root1203]|nr:carboxylesterase [Rhizobium sp. Root1203]